jgi:hypothetical protein
VTLNECQPRLHCAAMMQEMLSRSGSSEENKRWIAETWNRSTPKALLPSAIIFVSSFLDNSGESSSLVNGRIWVLRQARGDRH